MEKQDEQKKIYICIPTYNESENIIKLIERIKEESEKIYTYKIGIIVIDDNSPDGTGQLVEEYKTSQEDFEIQVIHNPGKSGLGKAYIQGFKLAIDLGAFAVMEMDADFSHDPKYIVDIIEEIKNYDFVLGSRYVKGGSTENWSLFRKFISYGGNLYTRIILLRNLHDFTGGFNLYRTELFNKVNLDEISSNGYAFQIELKYRALKKGATYKEIPINFKDRELGSSKFGSEIIKEAILKPWKLRFDLE